MSTFDNLPRFGPRNADTPSAQPCPACRVPFVAGDFTTLITLGPGADPEERAKAAEGRAYNAVALEVHWSCATGDAAIDSESRTDNEE